ncbi:hypothetical protein [Aliidiomarina indica]|uniref:hypothetical protein n=1 Tax=Aliidiomarina indica TaxID=2749147 RepID=UPI001E569F7E|nr:hypothetical protein [Aliidiomarina indica]
MNNIHSIILSNRVFGWIALATGLLLLIPLVAMQITHEVNWDLTDFIVMGSLIFVTASVFILVARRLPRKHWGFIGVGFLVLFVYLWAELAVGIFTTWGS